MNPMTMRRTILMTTLLVACWGAIPSLVIAATSGKPADVPRRPNIIVILADDLGYECIGANGGQTYKTPVLDKMAQSGMRFEHCYAQPLCTPSRVQMMTGIYNVRNYTSFAHLEAHQTTFAHLMKKAGYTTCMIGKWQLGGGEGAATCEMARHFGFDESYLTTWYAKYWNPTLVLNGKIKDYPKEDYGPDHLNELAGSFIQRNKDKPFFLYYTFDLPHDSFLPTPDSAVSTPWSFWEPGVKTGPNGRPTPVEGYKGKHINHNEYFGDMVSYMDKMVGKLMAKLDELGLRDNTIVIFTGDNGTPTGQALLNGQVVKAGKNLMTDAGTRVPLIVSWPAGIPKAGVCKDLVDFTDFLPTICEAGGAKVPAELKIDGKSFLPQLRGEPGHPRPWCYCWFTKYPTQSAPREWARNQRYKLYRTGEFYDIGADVLEQHPLTNLPPEAQAARAMLQQALDRYRDARPPEWAKNEKKTGT